MQITIFNTPILTPCLRLVARLLLKLHGWRVVADERALKLKKYVLLAAPHTSNWDGYFFILAALKLKVNPQWMGKDKLFKFPLGGTMRWFGGIAVDRSKANNLVEATVNQYKSREELVIAVPPEGTRGKTERWKTGFYHIARGAAVPVVCGFVDFAKKEAGLGPVMEMGENLAKELARFGSFYAGKVGKYPDDYTAPV
ncbi:1-acyl-sn-glycerol-3-phosphate acyltransferase [Microbulbifer hydrolyticus]|uniref:Acyltransferase n=1 Tax=Microbulbifer hydrolyticus TaxID=48074 RepID=A0A6P1T9C2_9GAMM|nr:1-acyl-sn-glycerol-3-phosphate acyltransferase [Microbulbifer hydrolyticus]MBB5210944.1 1-acyl-sn-glycerol-3-phosphate acyltransferase [Microbulbifer hydrolyticus]QHQ38243.1 acyltransferase [Microbulbifer hydrolyticus]